MSTFSIISGGHRPNGNTPRIARWVQAQLKARGHTTHLIDLADLGLPMWDEGRWGTPGLAEKWPAIWNPISESLKASDGFVVVSPEYHGGVSAMLKNFFMLVSDTKELAHKPGLIVTDTATLTNGAYPVMELRSVYYKNSYVAFLPEHLIVRDAGNILKDDVDAQHQNANDYVTKRAQHCFNLLEDYAEAHKLILQKGHMNLKDYGSGM